MKFIFLSLLLSTVAQAQIDLDRPVIAGRADEIYTSASSPNTFYFLPAQLCRISDVQFEYVGDRLIAEFNVGICPLEYTNVHDKIVSSGAQNPSVRILRGINSNVSKMQLDSMFPSYDPEVDVVGDAGDFDAPNTYRISFYSGYHHHTQHLAWITMQQLFGSDSIDAYIAVAYQFSSIFGGQVSVSNSSVAVYVAKSYAVDSTNPPINQL